jgi:predicted RNase H-like HicB family nuclease/DNA-binding XRE family transcriptional regulator
MIKPFEAIAVFYKDEEGYYQAFSPNIDGAISYGETLEEARTNIKEAMEGVIKTALDKDIANYFSHIEYKAKESETIETIKIDSKLQVAVSIKIAREKAGYSQRDFGKKLGMTQQSIFRYEKGIVIPSADKFLQLLGA